MSNILSHDDEIRDIMKSHLKIEQKVMSIATLFTESRLRKRIHYDPYYQRKYVWERDKATYFLESILLGTEIPPFVFFNTGHSIEVIDGRQRFQTIEIFLDEDEKFSLTSKGLFTLKLLRKKMFQQLDPWIQDMFFNTKLRILKFS